MHKKIWIISCTVIFAILSIFAAYYSISQGTRKDEAFDDIALFRQSQRLNKKVNSDKKNVPDAPSTAKDTGGSSTPVRPNDNSKRVVYLTIDDGPSITTGTMLDILKQYNVKATFFVIGNQIKGREELLKRMKSEGHSIGLHSYTHNIKHVYLSPDIFIKEMIDTADEINRIIGIRPVILRFPGGSRGYLNKTFLKELHSSSYKIYDWTISSGDGMYPYNTPEQIFGNAVDSGSLTNTAILLMHTKSNNQNSCDALPQIIEYYKKWGYEFETITDKTPEYYFRLKDVSTP